MTFHIVLLPGDGIGPEIMAQAEKILEILKRKSLEITWETAAIGGAAVDAFGAPFPQETRAAVARADAVLLAAVGGPQYDGLPREHRPERGLLALRQFLGVFANLRPAKIFPSLVSDSPLKESLVQGLDMLMVRELTGGIYFGKPRGIHTVEGQKEGFNTLRYREEEIARVAEVAFRLAQRRQRKVCSVDKANVLETSELWREVVERVARDYPDVTLSHMYVDNAAMQLIRKPTQFDVVLTDNMFGDILSDEAAMVTGSIGLLPSASLNAEGKGLYEPIHGSAPDIAGQDKANPIAMILSLAMLLEHSMKRQDLAHALESAVAAVLEAGVRTADITGNTLPVGCRAMGDAIAARFEAGMGVGYA